MSRLWTDQPVLAFESPSGLVLGGLAWDGGTRWAPMALTPFSTRQAGEWHHDFVVPLDGRRMLRVWIGEHALRGWVIDGEGEHEIPLRPAVGIDQALEDPNEGPISWRVLGDGWVQIDRIWISPDGEVFPGNPPPVRENPALARAMRGWFGTAPGWAALADFVCRHPGKPLPDWVGEAGWMNRQGDRLRGVWAGREWEAPCRQLWIAPDGRWLTAFPDRLGLGGPEGAAVEIPWEGPERMTRIEAQPLGDGWLVRTPERCVRAHPDGRLEALPPFPLFPHERFQDRGGWRIFPDLRPGFAVRLQGGPLEIFPEGIEVPRRPGWAETQLGGIVRLPPEGRPWLAMPGGRDARVLALTPPPCEGAWVQADRPAAFVWLPAEPGQPSREVPVPPGRGELQARCAVLPDGGLLAVSGWAPKGLYRPPREAFALVARLDRDDALVVPVPDFPEAGPLIRRGPDGTVFATFPGKAWALWVRPDAVQVVILVHPPGEEGGE